MARIFSGKASLRVCLLAAAFVHGGILAADAASPPAAAIATPAPHKLSAESEALMLAASKHMQEKQWLAALDVLGQAKQLDPGNPLAWVLAGNCEMGRQDYRQAELEFRRAAEIAPLAALAWLGLATALGRQSKMEQFEPALLTGIAAQPYFAPNWILLAQARKAAGLPLKRLAMAPRSAKIDAAANGRQQITLVPEYADDISQYATERIFWAAYFATILSTPKDAAVSPFRRDLHAWREGLRLVDNPPRQPHSAAPPGLFKDSALLTMQMLARAGQLEPALFLLLGREQYRPEFEAWKLANPNGVKEFIDIYGLMP